MTKGVDYTYPLPPRNLQARYDQVLSRLNKGLNCTLIGLPLSGRSGFLKFYLEKFFDDIKYVWIDDNKISTEQLVKTVAQKVLGLNIFNQIQQEKLEALLRSGDGLLIGLFLQDFMKKLPTKIIFFITNTEGILDHFPSSISFLAKFYKLAMFCFISSPTLLEKKSLKIYTPLRSAIEEKVFQFELLDKLELDYIRMRFEKLELVKIPTKLHEEGIRNSGGHYILYKQLVTGNNTDETLNLIWEGVPVKDKISGNLFTPLLPLNKTRLETKNILELTSQQKMIFDYLTNRIDQVVSRDDLAQVIWGKHWQEKYSDWAIDKSISQLKKKIQESNYLLSTLRSRGYRLCTR